MQFNTKYFRWLRTGQVGCSTTNIPTIIGWLNGVALIVLGFFCASWTVLMWSRYHVHMPWRDTLSLLPELTPIIENGAQWSDIVALVDPHYSVHRVLIPRLLLLLDVRYFHGQGHLLYAMGWLALFAIATLHISRASAEFSRRPTFLLILIGTALIFIFAPAHSWNLLNPLNISWQLSIGLSLLAFWSLTRSTEPPRMGTILLAYILTVAAAFSNFSGVIAWLLVPVILIWYRSQWSIAGSLLSATMIVMYTWNVHSDAEVAISWASSLPSSAASSAFTEDALKRIAANSPLTILGNAIHLLGWPLSRHQPLLALGIVVLSLLLLMCSFIQLICDWVRREEGRSQWQLYCSIGATYCVGIAVSVYLGRIFPYPDEVHGPSQERYQSFVTLYWMYSCGLLIYLIAPMKIPGRLLGYLLLNTGVISLIFMARSDYLENEIKSLEYAHIMFQIGENSAMHLQPSDVAASFTPRYALAFDPFFKRHLNAWYKPQGYDSNPPATKKCERLGISLKSVKPSSAFSTLLQNPFDTTFYEARTHQLINLRIRDLVLFRDNTAIGRLTPIHTGNYAPWQLVNVTHTVWMGGVADRATGPETLTLRLNLWPGTSRYCHLKLDD